MSAITVIYNLDNRPVEGGEMQVVLDSLKHRGDDDQGMWIDGNIGLGHRMRWTTPESLHETLPMKSAESSSVITCDARIDNRDELIPQLDFSGRPIEKITDAEIILKAYDKWGNDCIEKFIGDFVFAIWNPNEQKLVCARDSMGVKHFYYYYKPGEIFVIASEAKALFCLPGIPKVLNETNIGDILILNYQDKENTPFRNVKRLPANYALEIDENGPKIWQYWHPKPPGRFRIRSNKYYEEKFKALFSEAVTCRLRSAYAVGSMLSGGLDSSSISCVASRYLSEKSEARLETFSAIFPAIAKIDSRIDEREFINSVVNHIECNPNMIEADAFSPFLDMDLLQWHADHPVGVPNVFMDWALFKAAKDKGVRSLLSGFDGDSTVSHGYEGLYYLARQGRWIRLLKDAMGLRKNMPRKSHTLRRLVWKEGLSNAIPEAVFQLFRIIRRRPRKPVKVLKLPGSMRQNHKSINSDLAERLNLDVRYFELLKQYHPTGVSDTEAYWNSLSNGLFAFALETFEKASATFEIEPSYPFFDRRLIEFCISLPAGQKLYKGWTRSIFRRAMTGILPTDVQWRVDKSNIGLSFQVNMLKHGRDLVEETISTPANRLKDFIKTEDLTAAFRRYSEQPLSCQAEAMFILSSVYLSNWLHSQENTESFGSGENAPRGHISSLSNTDLVLT